MVNENSWHYLAEEVESVFNQMPHYRFIENGDLEEEDLYAVLAQTETGRYIVVFSFIKLLMKH